MKSSTLIAAFAALLGMTLAGIPTNLHASSTTNAPSAATPASAPTTITKVKKTNYKGTITAVDTKASTITLQGATSILTLAINAKTSIKKDKKAATLADFPIGTVATGSYTTDATGMMTAVSLHTKTVAPAAAPKTATPAAKPATPAKPVATGAAQ